MDPFNTTKVISPATYLIAGVALLLAGAIIGVFADPYLPASLSNAKKGYQSGFAAAQTFVENSSLGSLSRTQTDVHTVSGTVTAIQGNRITIHSDFVSNPLEGPVVANRIVTIDTNTKVIKLTEKTPAMIDVEMHALITVQLTKQATSTSVTISAEPYIQTATNASTIKVGDSVTVTAGENIKTLAEFTAQEIQIQPHLP